MKPAELTPLYSRLLVRLIRPFPNWDFFFIKPLRRRAVQMLQLGEGDRVLDAGCGPGGTFPFLLKAVGAAGEVVGIELSPETARNARKRIQVNGWTNVRLIEGDARTVALDGLFDGLVAFAAPDVYDSEAAVANITPHLREGARVVVFGAKLSDRPLAKSFNLVFRMLMKLSFRSTPQITGEPISVLRDKLTDIHVQEYLMGCLFLASGTIKKPS